MWTSGSDMGVSAGYYDGRVSTRREVTISLEGKALRIYGPGMDASYPLDSIRVTAGVGAIRRSIRLPNGGMCEVCNSAFLAEIERQQGKGRFTSLLHCWERSIPLASAAVVLTVAVVVIFMRFGVPALARHVAFVLPVSAEASLGRESLATLDRFMFKPSRVGLERQRELQALFRGMSASMPGGSGYRLVFRASPPLGANALALPSGIVVMTDAMVSLAKNNEELSAVLAHELGHVRERHLLRHVLQNSVATLLMATITGDIVSVTSLSATLPTALIDAKFSRDFEREADDAACTYLRQKGIPLRRYTDILSRLQTELDKKTKESVKGEETFRNYLSTHPATDERIRRILAPR
jgi:Zn-dependent protease with chaperone function